VRGWPGERVLPDRHRTDRSDRLLSPTDVRLESSRAGRMRYDR
jgi:hypothetical protein